MIWTRRNSIFFLNLICKFSWFITGFQKWQSWYCFYPEARAGISSGKKLIDPEYTCIHIDVHMHVHLLSIHIYTLTHTHYHFYLDCLVCCTCSAVNDNIHPPPPPPPPPRQASSPLSLLDFRFKKISLNQLLFGSLLSNVSQQVHAVKTNS